MLNDNMAIIINENNTNYFIIRALCIDENKELCTRELGLVRGMTDNGRPGWTKFGATGYPTIEKAKLDAKFPYSYSVYDGHYTGGDIWIVEVKVYTKTITEEIKHDPKTEL